MNRSLVFIGLLILGLQFLPQQSQGSPSGSFGIFYSSLSSYGEWIDCNLGYVWRPSHSSYGWRPYMNGRWIWTNCGWYWSSYEPFGWATFHYGRWYYDDYYGWIWIPGDVWAPAWVEWRYDNDYIGWAPLPPHAFFDINVGIRFTGRWITPHHYWSFVPFHRFTAERIVDYVQPVDRNPRIFGNTRSVPNLRRTDNRMMNTGVDVSIVEQRGNLRIHSVQIVERDRGDGDRFLKEGKHDRIEIYRPRLEGHLREEVVRPNEFRRAEQPIMLEEGVRSNRNNRRESYQRRQLDRRENSRIPDRKYEKPPFRNNREIQPRDQQQGTMRERDQFHRGFERPSVRSSEKRIEQPRQNDRPTMEQMDRRGREQDRRQGESRKRERRP